MSKNDQLQGGKVKFFNKLKGFGFITMEDESEIFFHITSVDEKKELKEGEDVEFYIGEGKRGPMAVEIRTV